MSVLFDPHEVGINGQTSLRRGPKIRRKEDALLVFGYACKFFESSGKGEEKSLIPWMGDESLLIDRFDARLYFTDKAQFIYKPTEMAPSLTPEEEEMERRCDEERYIDLHQDSAEHEIQQEEEMKRFQQELREDGAYNSVAFNYQYSAPEYHSQHPQTFSTCDPTQNEGSILYQAQQAGPTLGPSVRQMKSSSPSPPPFQQPEPFVPPEELEIPPEMEIPETAKMQAIIERTAVFVAKQGKQMEILVKAKQSGNPQFDFLLMDNWLNPYYKHVLKHVKEGKYVPEIPKQPSPKPQEEAEQTESEDESDGEYELHPLLQASLHKKVVKSQPSSASSSPVPDTLGNKFSRTFALITGSSSSDGTPQEQDGSFQSHYSEVDEAFDYSMWYPQDDMYGHYVSSAGYSYHPPVAPILSVADMIPPPPPPPGEGPLEEEWLDSVTSVLPLPPPPPPPVPPTFFVPNSAEVAEALPMPPPPGMSATPQVADIIIPPPPDLQPIVDKLANYVAKNGPDFESIIKAKNDPRFEFLNPWNSHYSYYQFKKQQALKAVSRRIETENGKTQPEALKGPISFSIKSKDTKKPKIEYRTSVIYKQSYEQGQSDEDGDEADAETENKETSDSNDGKLNAKKLENANDQETSEKSADDLTQQMDSIKAAERIAKHLESESRDKQLQLERRRKASLFISMLKNTNPGDEPEANKSSSSGSSAQVRKTRKFVESKGEKRPDSPALKRSRVDDDEDCDESVSGGRLGVPSPDSIRVTQIKKEDGNTNSFRSNEASWVRRSLNKLGFSI